MSANAVVQHRGRWPRTVRRKVRSVVILAATFCVLFILVLPVLWMIVSSIRPSDEIGVGGLATVPAELTFAGYQKLVDYGFDQNLVNSLFLATTATILATLAGLLAAYGFSRFRFHGRAKLLVLVVLLQLFPFVMVITPLYSIYSQIGLVDNYLGVILAYVAITQPFAVLMLLNYINSIPKDLDEAAKIDGCGTLGILARVIFPLAWPGVTAVAVFAFSLAWEDYLIASVLITGEERQTLVVALAGLFGEFGSDYQAIMAAATLGSLPTLILFLLLQRRLVANLAGAVKQ